MNTHTLPLALLYFIFSKFVNREVLHAQKECIQVDGAGIHRLKVERESEGLKVNSLEKG